jgi:hypothetical protein
MEKVQLLVRGYKYEGSTVVSVHKTIDGARTKANQEIEEYTSQHENNRFKENPVDFWTNGDMFYTIVDMKVQL